MQVGQIYQRKKSFRKKSVLEKIDEFKGSSPSSPKNIPYDSSFDGDNFFHGMSSQKLKRMRNKTQVQSKDEDLWFYLDMKSSRPKQRN